MGSPDLSISDRDRRRRRRFALAAIALITVAAGAMLPFVPFDGRIEVMLPERSELRDIFTLLRDVQVADKVLVTLAMADRTSNPEALIAAAERYVIGLDPALATPLSTGFKPAEIGADFGRLARQLPDYTSAAELDQLAANLSPTTVRQALASLRKRLHQPEGMFAAATAQTDPLDWNGRTMRKILDAVASFGYQAVPYQNHLLDQPRRHLLLILRTQVPITDTAGVRKLLDHLEAQAAGLPPGIEARLVCGHLHTAANEAIIRRDIQVTATAVVIVFLVLFIGVYRDWRAIGIVLIPFLASLPALVLAAAVFRSFSFIVIGFGSVIAGIAIDYGIHTYVAARSSQPERNLRLIRRPVSLSALTTLGVFVAFCFSDIPAYRQLGAFAAIAIVISLAYAFWVLPLCLDRRLDPGRKGFRPHRACPGGSADGVFRTAGTPSHPRPAAVAAGRGVVVGGCAAQIPIFRCTGTPSRDGGTDPQGTPAGAAELAELAKTFPDRIQLADENDLRPLRSPQIPLPRSVSWLLVVAGGVGLLVGLVLLFSLRLETDLAKLDGTPQAVLDEERRALATWGGGESLAAILCVQAPDAEVALQMNDQLYAGLLADGLEPTVISSLSPIYPAAATRQRRRQQWHAWWTAERLDHLRQRVEQEATALDFSPAAFQAFWQMFPIWGDLARETEPIGFLQPLYDSFVQAQDGIVRVVTFVPDLPEYLAAANRLQSSIPSLQVISRQAFSTALSSTISREIARLSLLATLFVLGVAVLLIRRLGMIVLSLVPAVAGVVWGGAGMALLGLPLNISNLIAGIIVFGLSIDYGISMVYAHRQGIQPEVFRAVTLSAATTVLGAAVLLLARHPALLSIGVTLVAGVAVGYLYAWLVLWALQTVWPGGNPPVEAPPAAGSRQGTGPNSPPLEETA